MLKQLYDKCVFYVVSRCYHVIEVCVNYIV